MSAMDFLNMDTPTLIITLLISLVVTAFAYLLVPAILVIKKKTYPASTINKIAIINAIVVVVVFSAIKGEPATGGFILWSGVAYWLLKKKCLLKPPSVPTTSKGSYSIAHLNAKPQTAHSSGIYGSDIALQKEEHQEAPQQAKRVKYCAHCGTEVNLEAVICVSCGCVVGEVPKATAPSSKKPKCRTGLIICNIAVTLVLCVSVAVNVYQATNAAELQGDVDALNIRVNALREYADELQADIKNYEELAEFCDDYVVFIEDDGSGLYHKFECSKFKGSSFWVYNVAAAEGEGYDPCRSCHS